MTVSALAPWFGSNRLLGRQVATGGADTLEAARRLQHQQGGLVLLRGEQPDQQTAAPGAEDLT